MQGARWALAWYPLEQKYIDVDKALKVRINTGGEYRENPCYHDKESFERGYGVALFPRREGINGKKAHFARYSDVRNKRAMRKLSDMMGMGNSNQSKYLNGALRVSTLIRNITIALENGLSTEIGIESYSQERNQLPRDPNSPDFTFLASSDSPENPVLETNLFIKERGRVTKKDSIKSNDWILDITKWETKVVMDWDESRKLFLQEWSAFQNRMKHESSKGEDNRLDLGGDEGGSDLTKEMATTGFRWDVPPSRLDWDKSNAAQFPSLFVKDEPTPSQVKLIEKMKLHRAAVDGTKHTGFTVSRYPEFLDSLDMPSQVFSVLGTKEFDTSTNEWSFYYFDHEYGHRLQELKLGEAIEKSLESDDNTQWTCRTCSGLGKLYVDCGNEKCDFPALVARARKDLRNVENDLGHGGLRFIRALSEYDPRREKYRELERGEDYYFLKGWMQEELDQPTKPRRRGEFLKISEKYATDLIKRDEILEKIRVLENEGIETNEEVCATCLEVLDKHSKIYGQVRRTGNLSDTFVRDSRLKKVIVNYVNKNMSNLEIKILGSETELLYKEPFFGKKLSEHIDEIMMEIKSAMPADEKPTELEVREIFGLKRGEFMSKGWFYNVLPLACPRCWGVIGFEMEPPFGRPKHVVYDPMCGCIQGAKIKKCPTCNGGTIKPKSPSINVKINCRCDEEIHKWSYSLKVLGKPQSNGASQLSIICSKCNTELFNDEFFEGKSREFWTNRTRNRLLSLEEFEDIRYQRHDLYELSFWFETREAWNVYCQYF